MTYAYEPKILLHQTLDERFEAPTDQGYTLRVMNYDQDSEGNEYGTWLNKTDPGTGALCAIQDETTNSQLSVQFCPFAIPATPNYLVLFYDEDERGRCSGHGSNVSTRLPHTLRSIYAAPIHRKIAFLSPSVFDARSNMLCSLSPLLTRATSPARRFVRDGAGAPCVPIGMWIFTRQQARNETLVDKVRSIAVAKGIDVSVLKYNNQTTCLS